jgi:hypothetical protein
MLALGLTNILIITKSFSYYHWLQVKRKEEEDGEDQV